MCKGTCRDCLHWERVPYEQFGHCHNSLAMTYLNVGDETPRDGLGYYDAGTRRSGVPVGDQFGCVQFTDRRRKRDVTWD